MYWPPLCLLDRFISKTEILMFGSICWEKNLNEKSNYNYVKIKSVVLCYYRNISTESIETCTEKKEKVKLIFQKVKKRIENVQNRYAFLYFRFTMWIGVYLYDEISVEWQYRGISGKCLEERCSKHMYTCTSIFWQWLNSNCIQCMLNCCLAVQYNYSFPWRPGNLSLCP